MKTLARTTAALVLTLLATGAFAQPSTPNSGKVAGVVKDVDFEQRTLTIVDQAGEEKSFSFSPSVRTIVNGSRRSAEHALEVGQTVELKLKQDNLQDALSLN